LVVENIDLRFIRFNLSQDGSSEGRPVNRLS